LPGKFQAIWDTVRLIPRGTVATYGEVAHLSGFTGQARLVGYALHALHPGADVPWHRVVNARGRISFPRTSTLYRRQMNLLRKEGVLIGEGRIDLSRYGWMGTFKNHYGLQ